MAVMDWSLHGCWLENNYHVEIYIIRYSDKCSEDFQVNYDRLKEIKKSVLKDLKEGDSLPLIQPDDVVIDAVFGSGLGKPVVDFPARVINHINASQALVVAIDMPSGLYCDEHTDTKAGAIIQADFTLSFQLPKLAFMFAENDSFVGEWKLFDIGLQKDFIEQAADPEPFPDQEDCPTSCLNQGRNFPTKAILDMLC